MNDNELLNGLKACLNYSENVHTFDDALNIYVQGGKSYVDGVLDNSKDAQQDPLYKLCILNLSLYLYQNRGISNIKNLPIGLTALINKLKSKYLD